MRADTTEAEKDIEPSHITLHQKSRKLEIGFVDGAVFHLPCEYLRVYSPSAEVRGHGAGQEILQTNKEDVNIDKIDPVGQYAVKLYFSDGHDSGLFSWKYLYALGTNQQKYWQSYLDALKAAGHERKPSS